MWLKEIPNIFLKHDSQYLFEKVYTYQSFKSHLYIFLTFSVDFRISVYPVSYFQILVYSDKNQIHNNWPSLTMLQPPLFFRFQPKTY